MQGAGGGGEPRHPVVGPQVADLDELGEGPGGPAVARGPPVEPGGEGHRKIRPGRERRQHRRARRLLWPGSSVRLVGQGQEIYILDEGFISLSMWQLAEEFWSLGCMQPAAVDWCAPRWEV